MTINKAHYAMLILIVCMPIIFLSGCLSDDEAITIDMDEIDTTLKTQSNVSSLKIAVSAMISPTETIVYYEDLLAYISKKINHPIELVQRETYAETNDLVESQYLDAAFVCSGAYIDGRDRFGMELLVAPVVKGEPVYYSYIIVPIDSDATRFEDLRGKKFAFTDEMSNTGKLSPTCMLALINETPDSFFSGYIFTYSHDKSIEAVSKGLVDGAAVDSLIWDYNSARNPVYTNKTKIISKSQPYGIPPIVVHPDTNPDFKIELQNILLTMHEDPEGADILKHINIDKFTIINNSAYDSVGEMSVFAEAQGAEDE
ncbi:MAG: phosphate/phosphite/phosphonate ABC transporter substrate-binding protein [Methanosarcinaceae archaeon]|nr:phosphate/phosphite/phosphonate ABC transporter substrate-binding protein [Methanosarcinaceae archaeon]MDF1533039.1 phosphate/phosphite/phosphonate ABC transporter substrate-binding protein [Methanosarcinaceae archaeon]